MTPLRRLEIQNLADDEASAAALKRHPAFVVDDELVVCRGAGKCTAANPEIDCSDCATVPEGVPILEFLRQIEEGH